MTDFLTSPSFLWAAFGITAALVIAVILWRNISWAPRGITPQQLIQQLNAGVTGLISGGPGRYLLIGIVVVAAVFGLWAVLPWLADKMPDFRSPSIGDAADFVGEHWFWFVALFAIAGVVAAIWAAVKKKPWKPWLEGAAIVAALVILGPQLWYAVPRWFKSSPICPPYSSAQMLYCDITTAKSQWTRPAEGSAINGMHLCFPKEVKWQRRTVKGTTLIRFWLDEGEMRMPYRLMPATTPCPSVLP